MIKYLTFLIHGKKIGIEYSDRYKMENTHINKVFAEGEKEFIKFRGDKIVVLDTGKILFDEPLKKFDGILFVYARNGKKIGFKSEGFYKDSDNVKAEIKPLQFLS